MTTGDERVLVVDDDEAFRRLIARMVGGTGHPVETAGDAAEGRQWLGRTEFALVICDLNMPGESGSDFIRWIHDEHPDVAILMATGTDDREVADAVFASGAYGYLVKPFKRNEVAINVANALRRRALEIENRDHRELLEQRVAERTAALRSAFERLQFAQDQLSRSHEEMIQRLSLAIEFRSHETGQHVERIGRTTELVARRLGLGDGRCETIRVASALHDVGKIGIPDTILLKPGALTRDERGRMEKHAEIGFRLLTGSHSTLLELAAQVAWTHHERFDGSGYPRRLAGDDIPLEGQITAIADVFDALTNDRVYRPAMAVDEALSIMRDGHGGQFHPDVLDVFMNCVDDVMRVHG